MSKTVLSALKECISFIQLKLSDFFGELPDFERLTLFMRDGLVSRTTNSIENYYRQTNPEQIKNKYKTDQGILSYLARKMEYWTAKLGRCLQHPTS